MNKQDMAKSQLREIFKGHMKLASQLYHLGFHVSKWAEHLASNFNQTWLLSNEFIVVGNFNHTTEIIK